MQNNSSTKQSQHISFNDDWSSHPAVEWMLANKQTLIYGFFGLILLLILSSRLLNWNMVNAEKDYFQAQALFTQFQNNPLKESSADNADFQQLLTLMERHSELKPKYDGLLAQTLIINHQPLQAQPLVNDIFKRTGPDHLQLYQNYTQATLLLSQGQYKEGLKLAQQLKGELDQLGLATHPMLYTYNLIRLALIHQELNQIEEERDAWNLLQNEPQISTAYSTANQMFKLGEASIGQYLSERLNALSNEANP